MKEIDKKQFLPFKMAKMIQKMGFDLQTYFLYGVQQQVRPGIIKKYGELSDDGYYELTEDCGCGGTLKFDEVYYNKRIIVSENSRYFSILDTDKMVAAPTYRLVGQWLYNQKKIFVNVNFKYKMEEKIQSDGFVQIHRYDKPQIMGYYFDVWDLENMEQQTNEKLYEDPDKAYQAGIHHALQWMWKQKKNSIQKKKDK